MRNEYHNKNQKYIYEWNRVSVRRFMMDAYKHLHVFIILPQQRSHNREKTTVDKETKTNMSIQETMNNDNSKRCNVKSDRFKIESKRRSPFPHTHTRTLGQTVSPIISSCYHRSMRVRLRSGVNVHYMYIVQACVQTKCS